jgi:DNA invertase Pin-like site-specific DNA recombinase
MPMKPVMMSQAVVPKLIAYYRVSTARQGASGLGLEAQRAAVRDYAQRHGGAVLRAYQEIESGTRSDRPELARALADARRSKATLIIAKLDRLSRNTRFLLALVESGVDLAFCDLPAVPPGPTGRFLLSTMAAVAELEAGLISQRTKAALAALKARGVKLGAAREGAHRFRGGANPQAAQRAATLAKERAADAYLDLAPRLADLRAEGQSYQAIADVLTAEGHTTRKGKPWNKMQVRRVLQSHQGKSI